MGPPIYGKPMRTMTSERHLKKTCCLRRRPRVVVFFQRGTQMSRQGKRNVFKHGGALQFTRVKRNSAAKTGTNRNNIVFVERHLVDDQDGEMQCPSQEQQHPHHRKPIAFQAKPFETKMATECGVGEDDVLDAQKVDEWLKNRSDSLSSIEFDNEVIKQEDADDIYEFEHVGQVSTTLEQSLDVTQMTENEFNMLRSKIEWKSIPGNRSNFKSGKTRNPKQNNVSPLQYCTLTVTPASGAAAAAGPANRCPTASALAEIKMENDDFEHEHPVVNGDNGTTSIPDSSMLFAKETCDELGFSEAAKGMTLMTPQEIERMPESGIEFEESVGPRELEILYNQETNGVSSEVPELPSSSVEYPKKTNGEKQSTSQVAATAASSTSSSSTLATISISTDKLTNTTSIVINTKQGQQSFTINTANLMQAAATLQPITLADLVDQRGLAVVTNPVPLGLPSQAEKCDNDGGGDHSTQMNSLMNIVADETTDLLANGSQAVGPQDGTEERTPTVACMQDEKGIPGSICTHSGRCKKVWTCPEAECGKMYTKQAKLKVHMMMHSNLRPFKCEVEGCDWAFTTIYKLKRHLETHCSMKDFVCDYKDCNRRFTTIYNLKSHKKLHNQEKCIKCSIENCSKVFHTRRKMELHMKEHQDVEAPYKCPIETCKKAYYTTNAMASHLRAHQKTTFECPYEDCNMVFDKMSRFKVHMWRHTGEKPYVCTYEGCNWAFSSASKLNRHARKHTGERHYTCTEPGCQKSFMRLEHLQGHMVTHSGGKPYACPHENCDARFTAKSSLYVHVKKHDGRADKTVYPCPVDNCDKKYNCKSSLRFHIQRCHSNKLAPTSSQVEYVTLVAADGLQDATATVDEFGQMISPVSGSGTATSFAVPGVVSVTEPMVLNPGCAANPLPEASCETTADFLMPSLRSGKATLDNSAGVVPPEPRSPASDDLTATSPTEVESLAMMSRVLQENNSGSARTDYCGNYVLRNRLRKLKQQRESVSSASLKQNRAASTSNYEMASNDAMLSSAALMYNDPTTGHHYVQTSLLQDEPSLPHNELYQTEGLLTPMAGELSLPVALLAEPTSGQGPPDFVVGSSSPIAAFTGTTINLQDLE